MATTILYAHITCVPTFWLRQLRKVPAVGAHSTSVPRKVIGWTEDAIRVQALGAIKWDTMPQSHQQQLCFTGAQTKMLLIANSSDEYFSCETTSKVFWLRFEPVQWVARRLIALSPLAPYRSIFSLSFNFLEVKLPLIVQIFWQNFQRSPWTIRRYPL